jgi:hypothetical protein
MLRAVDKSLPFVLAFIFVELQRRRRFQALQEYIGELLYVPARLRIPGRDYGRGSEWMISMREGHSLRIHNMT